MVILSRKWWTGWSNVAAVFIELIYQEQLALRLRVAGYMPKTIKKNRISQVIKRYLVDITI